MTLSLLSDLHGYVPSPAAPEIVDKADAVCICGDIQSRAMQTIAWINALQKPVVLVPGNHENRECGHIHTGDHTPVRLGSTLCRNVSYLDEQYAPAFLIPRPAMTLSIFFHHSRASAALPALCLAAALLVSCSSPPPSTGNGVPRILLDTDVGSSTDDLFALAMLYRYEDAEKCRLLGVVVDRPGEANAAFVDAMNAWAGRPELPVGLVRRGPENAGIFIDYAHVADTTDSAGRPLFPRPAPGPDGRPDGCRLYRRLLASQPDGSVTICSIGFLTCLAQLLESPPDDLSPLGGAELVRCKVARAVVMGGTFAKNAEPEYNFAMDPESVRTFFRLWPRDVEIVFSPAEVGDAIDYPPAQVVADIDWTNRHPIKQVYLQCDCDTGQRMWDPLAAIQAVEGDAPFALGDRGTVEIAADGAASFVRTPHGNCRRQLPGSPAWNASMLEKIRSFSRMR